MGRSGIQQNGEVGGSNKMGRSGIQDNGEVGGSRKMGRSGMQQNVEIGGSNKAGRSGYPTKRRGQEIQQNKEDATNGLGCGGFRKPGCREIPTNQCVSGSICSMSGTKLGSDYPGCSKNQGCQGFQQGCNDVPTSQNVGGSKKLGGRGFQRPGC